MTGARYIRDARRGRKGRKMKTCPTCLRKMPAPKKPKKVVFDAFKAFAIAAAFALPWGPPFAKGMSKAATVMVPGIAKIKATGNVETQGVTFKEAA